VAVGTGVAVMVGVGVAVMVAVSVGVGVGVSVGLVLVPVPGETTVAVALTEMDAVAEPETEGENTDGVLVEPPAEQPATVTEAKMARAPKPAAVLLADRTVPLAAARLFIQPPHAPGKWRSFPCFRHHKPGNIFGPSPPAQAEPSLAETRPSITKGHPDRADRQWRAHH
jgi:hypothetical protein